ncbi:MAG TPA: TetR/AcrR family transcriptional regulator [Coriobacteriia bacterium]|nr:TetR/AcrR family transcriptional regulator [Coriobacteriia bacterium]
MSPRPRADKAAKRAELAAAAAAVFAERGVANTAVSDIVKAAGVAQGTFYLYFKTKEDVIGAVVEQMVGGLLAHFDATLSDNDASAVRKFRNLTGAFISVSSDPAHQDLADFIHRRENRSLHHQLTGHLAQRLSTVVEAIVEQGVAEGFFDVEDAHTAAWFVLGGLQSIELRELSAAEMSAALEQVTELALKSLGYSEA